jgi:hypothetical protein
MLTRITFAFALTCFIAGFLHAADDPFCGRWKLNQKKSKITGEQMKIEDLGQNKFRFSFGNESDTVTADGTDQPVRHGRTLSLAPEGPNALRMVIKKDGKVLSSMIHALSEDGNTQTIKGTATKPDGTTSDFAVTDKRVGGGSGWTGTWESTDLKFNSPDEWVISPYGSQGLAFDTPAYKETLRMNFDGKDYPETGPNVAPGSASSGQRLDAHTLEITHKIQGKVRGHTRYEVSSDGRTLTLTVHETGQPNALTVVYDKL